MMRMWWSLSMIVVVVGAAPTTSPSSSLTDLFNLWGSGVVAMPEASGCNVSATPVVPNLSASSIAGNWYQLYTSKQAMAMNPFSFSNIRTTIEVDDFFPDTIKISVCTLNQYFFFKHNVCPALTYEMVVRADGVLVAPMPDSFKPFIAAMVPNFRFDQIQERVIAIDEEFLVSYSCVIPLPNDECAKKGLFLTVYSKNKELPPATVARLKAIADSTCVKFDELQIVQQDQDLQFYSSTST